MDGQPDILSFEPRPRRRDWWSKAGRGGRIVIVLVLLACLSVITSLALLVADRDHTITDLRTALRNSRHQSPAVVAGPALPVDSGSALFTLPDAALGSFSVVAAAVRRIAHAGEQHFRRAVDPSGNRPRRLPSRTARRSSRQAALVIRARPGVARTEWALGRLANCAVR